MAIPLRQLALLLLLLTWASALLPPSASSSRHLHGSQPSATPRGNRLTSSSSSWSTCTSSICSSQDAPMIFIFGASMVDAGENSVAMPLRSAADFVPYGSDYFGKPAGRWSNGRTFMDYITEGLGYGHIPAYLKLLGSGFSYGVNFASSGSTASNSSATGNDSRGLFCLLVQVDQFRDFQASFLSISSRHAQDKLANVRQRFSDSIYFVETAQNDYINADSESDLLDLNTTVSTTIASMKKAFQALYALGARTFVIMNVTPLGCSPAVLSTNGGEAQLDENNCNARWMEIVGAHNEHLNDLLSELRTDYSAAEWILFDAYSLFLDAYVNPSKYGIKYPFQACCGAGGPYNVNPKVQCGMDAQYINGTYVNWTKCDDPAQYLIWDSIHPVESFAYHIAQGVLNGTYLTPPFDIVERVQQLGMLGEI